MIKGIIYLTILVLVVSLAGFLVFNRSMPLQEQVKNNLIISPKGGTQSIDLSPGDGGSLSGGANSSSNPSSGGSGGGGGGGGSSGSGDESGGGQGSCSLVQIAYSLSNFNSSDACFQTGSNGCTDYEINCTITTTNLDVDVTGDFEIKLELTNTNNGNVLSYQNVRRNLSPGESKTFGATFDLQDSNGINGNFGCDFKTLLVPKKTSCT